MFTAIIIPWFSTLFSLLTKFKLFIKSYFINIYLFCIGDKMSVLENVKKKILKNMIIFCILPPLPVLLALLIISKLLENYLLFFNILIILLPIITLFTGMKIWLWRSVYLEPIEKLLIHVRNLKNMGYIIDDTVYEIFSENSKIFVAKCYDDIPKLHNYKLAAIEKGKGYTVFIGISDENKQVYDLIDIKVQNS